MVWKDRVQWGAEYKYLYKVYMYAKLVIHSHSKQKSTGSPETSMTMKGSTFFIKCVFLSNGTLAMEKNKNATGETREIQK